MTVLLITDIPPCTNYTAGLVTLQMCRAFQPGQLAAFIVMNPALTPEIPPDLLWLPIKTVKKPNEFGDPKFLRIHLGEFGKTLNETKKRLIDSRRIVQEAVQFGKSHNISQVWAILQGQTMVRLARRASQKLGVPFTVQIWDPLSWWHSAHKVDALSAHLDQREFWKSLSASKTIITASAAMTKHVRERLPDSNATAVIASVDHSTVFSPPPSRGTSEPVTLGMAGQFYAADAWQSLCAALESNNWTLGERKVRLLILGSAPPPGNIPPEYVDYRGWLPQTEVIATLSKNCDILYCPYPFSAEMSEVTRFSFPSKLVTYMAAGRPILFHGPENASVYNYLSQNRCGFTCPSLKGDVVLDAIESIVKSPLLARLVAQYAQETLIREFTLDVQSSAVKRIFNIDDGAEPNSEFRDIEAEDDLPAGPHLTARYFDPSYYGSLCSARGIDPGDDVFQHYLTEGWRMGLDPNPWFSIWYYRSQVPCERFDNVDPLAHYLSSGWKSHLDPNQLFSTKFYLRQHSDVAELGVEPMGHYLEHGWKEQRAISPLFSPSKYVELNPDLRGDSDPLIYQLTKGWREGRPASVYFSGRDYLKEHTDIEGMDMDPLAHYLRLGWKEGRKTAGIFDDDYYKDQISQRRVLQTAPLLDYLERGWSEMLDPTPWFNTFYYLNRYRDVWTSKIEPLEHYLRLGWRDGRDPNSVFSTSFYLQRNPDLALRNIEPVGHYLTAGASKNQDPSPLFPVSLYLERYGNLLKDDTNPLIDYLSQGWREGRSPNAYFSVRRYLTENPDVRQSDVEPFAHYLLFGWKEGREIGENFSSSWYLSDNPDLAGAEVAPLVYHLCEGWREGRNPNAFFSTRYYLDTCRDAAETEKDPFSHYVAVGWRNGCRPNEKAPAGPGLYDDSVRNYEDYVDWLEVEREDRSDALLRFVEHLTSVVVESIHSEIVRADRAGQISDPYFGILHEVNKTIYMWLKVQLQQDS